MTETIDSKVVATGTFIFDEQASVPVRILENSNFFCEESGEVQTHGSKKFFWIEYRSVSSAAEFQSSTGHFESIMEAKMHLANIGCDVVWDFEHSSTK